MTKRQAHRRPSRPAVLCMIGALLAAVIPAVVAQPAYAASDSLRDPAGDLASGADIRSVRIYNERPIVVKVFHRDLRRSASPSVSVYIDTNVSRSGPEYVLNVSVWEWYMWRTRGWRAVGGYPLASTYFGRFDYSTEVTTVRIPRRSLGYPGHIRVSVVARDGRGAPDHAPRYHAFSPWLGRG
jgi:hypothetical protein